MHHTRTTIILSLAALALAVPGAGAAEEIPLGDYTAKHHAVTLTFPGGATAVEDCTTGRSVADDEETPAAGLCGVYRRAGWAGLVREAADRGAAQVSWRRIWNAAGDVRWTFTVPAAGATTAPAVLDQRSPRAGCGYRGFRTSLRLSGDGVNTTDRPVNYAKGDCRGR